MTVTWQDAKARRIVRTADGKTGVLVAVGTPDRPGGPRRPANGTARIQLSGTGAFVNRPAADVELVEETA